MASVSGVETIIVPAWLYPWSPLWTKKGETFVFGAFMITDQEYVFADESEVLFRLPREGTAVVWPWWFAGVGIRLIGNGARKSVAFGHLTPLAPSPEPERFHRAAESLGALAEGPGDNLAGLLADIAGDLVGFFTTAQNVKSGKAVAKRLRPILDAPPAMIRQRRDTTRR